MESRSPMSAGGEFSGGECSLPFELRIEGCAGPVAATAAAFCPRLLFLLCYNYLDAERGMAAEFVV